VGQALLDAHLGAGAAARGLVRVVAVVALCRALVASSSSSAAAELVRVRNVVEADERRKGGGAHGVPDRVARQPGGRREPLRNGLQRLLAPLPEAVAHPVRV
jgi:hypothetical protein